MSQRLYYLLDDQNYLSFFWVGRGRSAGCLVRGWLRRQRRSRGWLERGLAGGPWAGFFAIRVAAGAVDFGSRCSRLRGAVRVVIWRLSSGRWLNCAAVQIKTSGAEVHPKNSGDYNDRPSYILFRWCVQKRFIAGIAEDGVQKSSIRKRKHFFCFLGPR